MIYRKIKKIYDNLWGENPMLRPAECGVIVALVMILVFPFDYFTLLAKAQSPTVLPAKAQFPVKLHVREQSPVEIPDDRQPLSPDSVVYADAEVLVKAQEVSDSIPPTEVRADDYPYGLDGKIPFNPSPQRAVWLSALCPGLGQIYNRRYWKLPIVVGGFMGLGYATNWNNNQYQDYVQGYRDLMDSDPNTNSYLDFFPPTVNESDLDTEWLKRTFKSRRDYFRRNRDLCIICLVALYLVCMVDAYIDASMAHFDITPDLSLDMTPTLMVQPATRKPALGINWAFTF